MHTFAKGELDIFKIELAILPTGSSEFEDAMAKIEHIIM
jgi:hypothetical protein